MLKDSDSFDDQTIWALKMFHEILVDLAARAPTRNLTRVLVSSTISLAGEEGVGLKELSDELGIPVATVSYAVTGLLKDGVLSPIEDESDARRHPTRYSFKERALTLEWAETITMISVRMAVEVFGGVEPAIEQFREIARQDQTPLP